MSATQGDANAAANAYPNMAVGNLSVYGGTVNQGGSTVTGNSVRTGSETISGSSSIGGSVSIGGANAASVVAAAFTGATITGAATGTLTNGPHSGNPFTFLEITVNGTTGAIPVFALS